MNRTLLIAFISTLLLGCAAPGPSPAEKLERASLDLVGGYSVATAYYLQSNTEESAIEKAKASIQRDLKDPDSAQFRNIRIEKFGNGKVICGEVNAKNSYGGYVGYRRFVASPESSTIESTGGRYARVNALSNTGLDAACGR